jgi:hypothetical protein
MPEFQLIEPFGPGKMPSGWLGRFLRFAVVLFLITLVVYFVIHYVYLGVLDRRIGGLENKIKGLEQEIPTQDGEEVAAFYSQLVNLRTLLEKHIYPSQIFERLELTTHPQVTFANFNYDFGESRIQVDGYAQNLGALAEQLLAFQRTSDFQKINLSDVRQGASRLSFTIEIFFKSSLVLKNF